MILLQHDVTGRVFLSAEKERKSVVIEEIQTEDWFVARAWVDEDAFVRVPGFGWFIKEKS